MISGQLAITSATEVRATAVGRLRGSAKGTRAHPSPWDLAIGVSVAAHHGGRHPARYRRPRSERGVRASR